MLKQSRKVHKQWGQSHDSPRFRDAHHIAPMVHLAHRLHQTVLLGHNQLSTSKPCGDERAEVATVSVGSKAKLPTLVQKMLDGVFESLKLNLKTIESAFISFGYFRALTLRHIPDT